MEATQRTEDPMLIEIVDAFLTKLTAENNREYTPVADYGENITIKHQKNYMMNYMKSNE